MCQPLNEKPPCVTRTVTGEELATFILDSVREAKQHLRLNAVAAVEYRLDVIERVLSRVAE